MEIYNASALYLSFLHTPIVTTISLPLLKTSPFRSRCSIPGAFEEWYSHLSNRPGNFSKWFTTTHVADLALSPSSQEPTNNTWSPGTRQKEYWHILHCIKCKLKLQDMGVIPIRVHMTQGCVSVGMIPIKPEVKENTSQALFSFIP